MKLTRLALIVVVVPAVAYGVVKGLMYLNAKQSLDDLSQQISPFAELSYDGISTEIAGAVHVRGITLSPVGYSDGLYIDRVRVATADPLFFIVGKSFGAGEAPPESMHVAMQGATIDLSSPMVEEFRRSMKQQAAAMGAAADSGGCSQGIDFDPAVMDEIGVKELTIDADMGYTIDRVAESLNVNMNFDLIGIEAVEMRAELDNLRVEEIQASGGEPPPVRFVGASMRMRVEPEFGRKLVAVCAQRTGLSSVAYVEKLQDDVLAEMKRGGITLGHGLATAFRDFYSNWGDIELRLRPAQPLPVIQLMFTPPERMADTLGFTLRVNDKVITDTHFEFDPAAVSQAGMQFKRPGSGPVEPAPETRRYRVNRSYQPVAVARLGSHVDSTVRIKPYGQPERIGRLVKLTDSEAVVEQKMQGGKFSAYVPLQSIEQVEVEIVTRKLIE